MSIQPIITNPSDPNVKIWDLDRRVTALEAVRTAIASGSIVGSQLTPGIITADLISSGAVNATHLAANSVNTVHINADAVTADKIDVVNLAAVSGAMGTVTGGVFQTATSGARVMMGTAIGTTEGTKNGIVGVDAGGAITFLIETSGDARFKGTVLSGSTGLGNIDGATTNASLLIGGSNNLQNPSFTTASTSEWVSVSNATIAHTTATTLTPPGAMRVTKGTSAASQIRGGSLAAAPSDAISVSAFVLSPSTVQSRSFKIGVQWLDGGGSVISTVSTTYSTLPGQWKRIFHHNAIAPASTASCRIFLENTDGAASEQWFVDDAVLCPGVVAQGSSIIANSITAAEIKAGSIDATRISVNQLSALSANMGTITAGSITSATITASLVRSSTNITYTGGVWGATGPGVGLSAGGFRAYASSSVIAVDIPASGGTASFAGSLAAAGITFPTGSSGGNAVQWFQTGNPTRVGIIYVDGDGTTNGAGFFQIASAAGGNSFQWTNLSGEVATIAVGRTAFNTRPRIYAEITSAIAPAETIRVNLINESGHMTIPKGLFFQSNDYVGLGATQGFLYTAKGGGTNNNGFVAQNDAFNLGTRIRGYIGWGYAGAQSGDNDTPAQNAIYLDHRTGSYPGSPTVAAPCLTATYSALYIVVAGAGSAYFDSTGVHNVSSSEVKEEFEPFETEDILQRLASMPVAKFKWREDRPRHKSSLASAPDVVGRDSVEVKDVYSHGIGPTSQDFHAAFPELINDENKPEEGPDPTEFIPVAASIGAALAGIKALIEKVDSLESRLSALEA